MFLIQMWRQLELSRAGECCFRARTPSWPRGCCCRPPPAAAPSCTTRSWCTRVPRGRVASPSLTRRSASALLVRSFFRSLLQVLGGPLCEVSSPTCAGDGLRGGGCCSDLPVFFSLNSGLVAVVARESVSILPETMEDSLCSSLTAAPEVRLKAAAAPGGRAWSSRSCVSRCRPWRRPSGLSRSLRRTGPNS